MGILLSIWAIFGFAAWMNWQHDGWIYLAAAGLYSLIYFAGKAGWLKWLAPIAKIFRFLH